MFMKQSSVHISIRQMLTLYHNVNDVVKSSFHDYYYSSIDVVVRVQRWQVSPIFTW